MQVFMVHPNAKRAAEMLFGLDCPRAVATTIREGQQILSTTASAFDLPPLVKIDGTDYGTENHPHHTYTKWFRKDLQRWLWLFNLVSHLVEFRWGEDDVRSTRLCDYWVKNIRGPLPDMLLDPPPFKPEKSFADHPDLQFQDPAEVFLVFQRYIHLKYPGG